MHEKAKRDIRKYFSLILAPTLGLYFFYKYKLDIFDGVYSGDDIYYSNTKANILFILSIIHPIFLVMIFYYIPYIIFSVIFRIKGWRQELFSKETLNSTNIVTKLLLIILAAFLFIIIFFGSTLFLRGEAAIFAIFTIPLSIPISLALALLIIRLLFGKKNEQRKLKKQ
ncbi:MAG: hypothetical protein WCT33_03545 [Patescibacteria group bacterium]